MEIRLAKKSDFEGVFNLNRGFWPDTNKIKKAEFRKAYLREFKEKNVTRFLLFEKGELIGCLALARYWITHTRGYQMILEEIIVAKKHRGKGYGLKLLDCAIRYAKKQGAKELWLETGIKNTAQKLYTKRMKKAKVIVFKLRFK